jgi:hypothetical protein
VLELLAWQPAGLGTRLSEGMRYAEKVLRQRSTVFVISDFLTGTASDPDLAHAARKLAWHHDVVPIRLVDPAAGRLPRVGLLAVTDPETGRRRVVDTGRKNVREQFAAAAERSRAEIEELFRDLQLDTVDLDTTQDYLPPLIGFFRHRARTLR